MKEGIGGTQIFVIVITLVLLFSGIMAFTINHSNAFAVKDELVAIIENAGSFDMTAELMGNRNEDETLQEIVDALEHNSYRQIGTCPENDDNYEVSAYQRDGKKSYSRDKSSFCIVKIMAAGTDGTPESYYYQIIVFYSLDLPVINELFNFKALGQTKVLYG